MDSIQSQSQLEAAGVIDKPRVLPRRIEFPPHQAMAYVIGVPTLLLAPMAYWQYDSALFGPSGLTKLFLITGIGGAVSFGFFGGQRRWLIAAVLGLIGGLGAACAHVVYTGIFHRETMMDSESALICLAGAGPAMAPLAYLLKRDKKNPPPQDLSPIT